MVCWAAYALLQKAWASPLDATARLAAICVGGVVTLLPFALWEAGQPGLTQWNLHALVLVLVAVLAVQVIVQAGEQDGTAGRTTGRRAEGEFEARAVGRELVQVRRADVLVAVAAEVATVVVGDDQHDIARPGRLNPE